MSEFSVSSKPLFELYTELLAIDWNNDTWILDFGGWDGENLIGRRSGILASRFYVVDCCPVAIAEGRRKFPDATWIHYNTRSRKYNPSGQINEPFPDLRRNFSLVFSSFTLYHMTSMEAEYCIASLIQTVAPGGRLLFNVPTPEELPQQVRLPPAVDITRLAQAIGQPGVELINISDAGDICVNTMISPASPYRETRCAFSSSYLCSRFPGVQKLSGFESLSDNSFLRYFHKQSFYLYSQHITRSDEGSRV